MSAEEYRIMLHQDFLDVELDEMTNLAKCRIDREQSEEKRKEQYLKHVGNPYLVRVNSMKFKVRFSNNGISLTDAFQNMLLTV